MGTGESSAQRRRLALRERIHGLTPGAICGGCRHFVQGEGYAFCEMIAAQRKPYLESRVTAAASACATYAPRLVLVPTQEYDHEELRLA